MMPRVSLLNEKRSIRHAAKRNNKIVHTTLEVQRALGAKRYSLCLPASTSASALECNTGRAIVAVSRELFNTIFYTLKNNWMFEDFFNFVHKPCDQPKEEKKFD